jgi:hypothetical protein
MSHGKKESWSSIKHQLAFGTRLNCNGELKNAIPTQGRTVITQYPMQVVRMLRDGKTYTHFLSLFYVMSSGKRNL